jgi:transcriptional regulator with XRE-family HTH domain
MTLRASALTIAVAPTHEPTEVAAMSQPSRHKRRCVCGALLARDNTDGRCASCCARSRLQPSTAPEVPPEFWDYDPMKEALNQRHMGLIIRTFRNHPGHGRKAISQETAASWAGITQAQLSRIENGAPIRHLDRLVQWAATLRIPAKHLWFSLPAGDGAQGESVNVNRSEFLRTAGLAMAGTAASRLFAGLPVSAVSEQDCAQWLAWELWQRKTDTLPERELPAPIALYLANRSGPIAAQMILRSSDGSYSFAHSALVDFYVGQRIFSEVASGGSKLFATSQTTHDPDLVIREFVLRSQASARSLTQWMTGGSSAVLRVNSAGVLAKLGSAQLSDQVVRSLKSDTDTRQLYLTAVASRVLELPWDAAASIAATVEHGPDIFADDPGLSDHMADRLAAELANPRDGAARWCSVVLLNQVRNAAPTISSSAFQAALHREPGAENLRSIGAALAGDNPISC